MSGETEIPETYIYVYEDTFATSKTGGILRGNRFGADGTPKQGMKDLINKVKLMNAKLAKQARENSTQYPRLVLVNAEIHRDDSADSPDKLGAFGHFLLARHILDQVTSNEAEGLLPTPSQATGQWDFQADQYAEAIQRFRDGFRQNGFVLFLGSMALEESRSLDKRKGTLSPSMDTQGEMPGKNPNSIDGMQANEAPVETEKVERRHNLRRAEFYVRTCGSAGLSRYVHVDIGDTGLGHEDWKRLESALMHCWETKRNNKTSDIRKEIQKQFTQIFNIANYACHSYNSSVRQRKPLEEGLSESEIDDILFPLDNSPSPDQEIKNKRDRFDDSRKNTSLEIIRALGLEPLPSEYQAQYSFLRQLAAINMLGKAQQEDIEKEAMEIVPWLEWLSMNTIRRRRSREAMLDVVRDKESLSTSEDDIYMGLRIERRYEVYRDLARCMVRGVAFWATKRKRKIWGGKDNADKLKADLSSKQGDLDREKRVLEDLIKPGQTSTNNEQKTEALIFAFNKKSNTLKRITEEIAQLDSGYTRILKVLVLDDVVNYPDAKQVDGQEGILETLVAEDLSQYFLNQLCLTEHILRSVDNSVLLQFDIAQVGVWKDLDDFLTQSVHPGLPLWEIKRDENDRFRLGPKILPPQSDSAREKVELIRINPEGGNQDFRLHRADLQEYDFILLDTYFRISFPGPHVVRLLSNRLEESAREQQKRTGSVSVQIPRIIVITRLQSIQNVTYCLGFGADFYLDKRRMFQLPARFRELCRAPKQLPSYKSVSNFRSVEQLLPATRALLDSDEEDVRITGGDPLSKAWIKRLPKADIHFHIGTCIDPETIEALAINTVGYLSRNVFRYPFQKDRKKSANLHNKDIFIKLALIVYHLRTTINKVIRAGIAVDSGDLQFSQALIAELGQVEDKNKPDRNPMQPEKPISPDRFWDDIIDHWTKVTGLDQRPVHFHEIVGLVVSFLTWYGKGDLAHDASTFEKWEYINNLQKWFQEKNIEADVLKVWLKDRVQDVLYRSADSMPLSNYHLPPTLMGDDSLHTRVDTRRHAGYHLLRSLYLLSFEEQIIGTKVKAESDAAKQGEAILKQKGPANSQQESDEAWEQWLTVWDNDPENGFDRIREEDSIYRLQPVPDLTLANLIDSRNSTCLLEYLRGAGLLGAEHLQYPENLLLAAHSIVQKNRQENIVYSEVRCETTGYARGGMTARNATRLLLLAFDVAVVYECSTIRNDNRSWIRVNILLGAKRHKKSDDIRSIVQLLVTELQRGAPPASLYIPAPTSIGGSVTTPPDWWKPCAIVGFDLSGNENADRKPEEMIDLIRPLFRESAPITIHAGEAASAESIWQAVFQFGARRIGHGLRLREQPRLLEHCVTRKICMELCPISNAYTNQFEDIEAGDREDTNTGLRYAYPLRHYLNAGMDVSINTDNRFLHGSKSSLTDEYLKAADLAGFLTRAEVLKIACSGFRNAFLEEEDANQLISYIESQIYDILARA